MIVYMITVATLIYIQRINTLKFRELDDEIRKMKSQIN
jgi:hypothetical protein